MLQNIANIIILLGAVAVAIKNINTLLQPPTKKMFEAISKLPLRKRIVSFFRYGIKQLFTSRSKKLETDMYFMKQVMFELASYQLKELYIKYRSTQELPAEEKERIYFLRSNCEILGCYNHELKTKVDEIFSWKTVE